MSGPGPSLIQKLISQKLRLKVFKMQISECSIKLPFVGPQKILEGREDKEDLWRQYAKVVGREQASERYHKRDGGFN